MLKISFYMLKRYWIPHLVKRTTWWKVTAYYNETSNPTPYRGSSKASMCACLPRIVYRLRESRIELAGYSASRTRHLLQNSSIRSIGIMNIHIPVKIKRLIKNIKRRDKKRMSFWKGAYKVQIKMSIYNKLKDQ